MNIGDGAQTQNPEDEDEDLIRLRTAAVVLAAGGGSRFVDPKNHKLLANFRGAPLVSWAIGAAHEASLDALYVVTGAVDCSDVAATASNGDAVVVTNPDWGTGQASSLALAIDTASAAGFDAVVIGLGDQPLVPPQAWRLVAAKTGPIVVATFDGHRRPPTKLEKSVWAEVPRHGDEGARNLIQLRPELVSEVACSGNPVDIDTIEDLEQWN